MRDREPMYSLLYVMRDKCPPGLPAGFWHSVRRTRAVTVNAARVVMLFWVVILVLLCVMPTRVLDAPLSFKLASTFVSLAAILSARAWLQWGKRRFCRRLAAADYEICFHCGYDLRGLPDHHRCPECGGEYLKAKVVEDWKRWALI